MSAAVNSGVPVADMDDAYVQSTAKLMEAIVKYATLDLYSQERLKVNDVSDRRWQDWLCDLYQSGHAQEQQGCQADSLTGQYSPDQLQACRISSSRAAG